MNIVNQLVIFISLIFLVGCNNNNTNHNFKKNDEGKPENVGKHKAAKRRLCFSKMEKDTVLLQIMISDSAVSGNLFYRLFEKDQNRGTIRGRMSGDTLIANYTFWSEGVRSERQVAFLIQDSVAVEGFGEIKEENGKIEFADPRTLNFAEGIVLQKTNCDESERIIF